MSIGNNAKNLVLGLTALGAMTIAAPAAAQSADSVNSDPGAVMPESLLAGTTVTLRVDGMTCPFCAYGLEKHLTALDAVDSVVVRISDGLVQIREVNGQVLSDEILKETVTDAGFSLREITRDETR
jgi:mercuric ion binding protein